MFFDLVSRNSKRNRKENGLFFFTMLISIIAFYVILALSHQDVMLFLADIESDAVSRLIQMIPLFYGLTLFILFFLIYYASKYQFEGRRHEFGIYQMMGMRRLKLFLLLLAEDIKNSFTALLIALPIGIAIAELISLITARLVGLGIIGHQFSLSLSAIIWTIIGFLSIKLVALLILSGKIAQQEIGDLLSPAPVGSKKQLQNAVYAVYMIVGFILLFLAYFMAIIGLSWSNSLQMAITLFCGVLGTFLIFYGLRSFMDFAAKKQGKGHRLGTFSFRQLQEEVICKSNSMAISSLLILAALCCFGSGISIALRYSKSEQHTIDYSFSSDDNSSSVKTILAEHKLQDLFETIFDVKVGYVSTDQDYDVYSMDSVIAALETLEESTERQMLIDQMEMNTYPYLISESGYNQLLSIAGEPELKLENNEAAVYMDSDFISDERVDLMNEIIQRKPRTELNDQEIFLSGKIQSRNIVVDRYITLSFALIVTDDVFEQMTQGRYTTYENAVLAASQKSNKSLLNAISDTNLLLNKAGINYESYLQNMGRQMFYVVAASYITIYLAIVFLIIANTVIGIQFLMQQQRTNKRYKTLIRIGASYQLLCYTANRQINWFFGIPVILAAVSSIFGIYALYSGILAPGMRWDFFSLMPVSIAMILLLCVVEYLYMKVVRKSSDRYLLSLMTLEREE